MERSALWLIMLIAGCTASPPQQPQALADAIAIGAPPQHRRPQPLNCGTPFDFKICPVPRMPITMVESLPPIAVPVVDIIEMPPPEQD